MRTENEKRVQTYVEATDKNTEHKRALQSKAKESDCEMRRQRADQLETIQCKRRQEVVENGSEVAVEENMTRLQMTAADGVHMCIDCTVCAMSLMPTQSSTHTHTHTAWTFGSPDLLLTDRPPLWWSPKGIYPR